MKPGLQLSLQLTLAGSADCKLVDLVPRAPWLIAGRPAICHATLSRDFRGPEDWRDQI